MTPEELKTWRQERYASKADLAAVLGIHWMTIYAWEKGRQQIPPYLELALQTVDRKKLLPKKPDK